MLGNGVGGFTQAAGSPRATGVTPVNIATGDFNGDGNLDLVTVNYGGHDVTLLLGNGTVGFTPAAGGAVPTDGTSPYSIALGDFNLDGRLDLATTNTVSNNASVLLGNGAGGLTAAPGSPFATGTLPYGVAVGEFNGDGKPDLQHRTRAATP